MGKISQMDPAVALTGNELLEVVQGGDSRKATLADLAAFGESARSLLAWAYSSAFRLATSNRDQNGAIVTANIVWPDGVTGVFTTDVASTTFPGAIDAWHATYAGTPVKTVVQTAVTRDAIGAVIAQPAITIS